MSRLMKCVRLRMRSESFIDHCEERDFPRLRLWDFSDECGGAGMKRVKLSDAFDLQMGKTPSRKHLAYWRGGTEPWISIADLSNCGKYIEQTKENITSDAVQESNIKIVPKNTVVMSFKLSIGKVAITKRNMYTNEAIMAFHDRGRYEILTDYLYYFCKGNNWSAGTNKAVMGLTLNKKTLSEQTMLLPDMPEQEKIVKNLDALQESISNRQRVLTLLDELVRSRFVEMFGDPVKNPYRWPKKLLTDLGDCKNGMNFHRDDEGYEIHCLGVGDFQNLSVISDAEKLPLISLDTVPSQEYLLQDEDVVFVRSNGNKKLVGRCVAVYPKDVPTTFSGFCIRFRKNNKIEIQTKYLLQVLKSDGVKMQMEGRGANIQNLNQKILSQVEIPIPPLSLQTQFATFVHQVDATKSSVQSQLDSLTTLRAKLMQDFFG